MTSNLWVYKPKKKKNIFYSIISGLPATMKITFKKIIDRKNSNIKDENEKQNSRNNNNNNNNNDNNNKNSNDTGINKKNQIQHDFKQFIKVQLQDVPVHSHHILFSKLLVKEMKKYTIKMYRPKCPYCDKVYTN